MTTRVVLASHYKQHMCVERTLWKWQSKINYICQNLTHGLVGMEAGGRRSWCCNNWPMTCQIHCEWRSSGCVASRGSTVEWVKRSQSRNCSLNMCHTLKCRGKHPYTHQYDEQKSPKPKLWSLYFCYRGEEKILENKNKTQNRRGREETTPDINAECREDELHKLGETLRHKGLFPGARLLISKSTGLEDPCWSRGVHGDAYSKMP